MDGILSTMAVCVMNCHWTVDEFLNHTRGQLEMLAEYSGKKKERKGAEITDSKQALAMFRGIKQG